MPFNPVMNTCVLFRLKNDPVNNFPKLAGVKGFHKAKSALFNHERVGLDILTS